MSVFQVTHATSNLRLTINAANVVAVEQIPLSDCARITLVNEGTLDTKESYRSVRNYLKKALAPASKDAE
ncbi:hypothetical protein ECBP1_0030 [Escherichia phage ECBP1]|uniref:Uncharacterized protein n=1 Tax=Escherichia phage ECBP1 TaxID=1604356 RepID=J9SFY3_9CAUD|nr:hypothetical protein ECBP1_0030 [Escherichia phage ECBP1]AFR51981.1 hypothetical protein ECBP1_0030 [Escherichia phage ECBP1]